RMSSPFRGRLSCVHVAVALIASGCGTPADNDLQQAQGAIDAAFAVAAYSYASDEFTAANDALKKAIDALNDHDYPLASTKAVEARAPAEMAAKQAVNVKAAAHASAERALGDAGQALGEARARLTTAEGAGVSGGRLNEARQVIAEGDIAIQTARAALQKE